LNILFNRPEVSQKERERERERDDKGAEGDDGFFLIAM